MNLSNCSAKVIRVGPRLPFATRIASVRGPEGHLTKALGNLWARTLFFLFIRSSKRHVFPHLPNFGDYPTPHLPRLTRVASRRSGALFFARHLDYFIVTQNSHPSPGLDTVKTASS